MADTVQRCIASLTDLSENDVIKVIELYENLQLMHTMITGQCQTIFGTVKFEKSRFWLDSQSDHLKEHINHRIDVSDVVNALSKTIAD